LKKKAPASIGSCTGSAPLADAIDMLHAVDKYDYSYLWSWMGVPINFLPT